MNLEKIEIAECFQYLNNPMRFKGAYGGRGSGKSWAFAGFLALLGKEAPLNILCGREYQNSINDSVKSLIDNTINRYEMNDFYNSQKTEIVGANGTRFTFVGLKNDPQKIKSMEDIDIFWGEEANTINAESLKILIPTLRNEWSELWFSYNRKLIEEPVHDLAQRPNSIFKEINFDQNPFFPQVLRDEMEYDKARDIDKYNHVWLGQPQQMSQASVFKGKFVVEGFDTPEDVTFYYGGDFGFSTDPLALVRCFIKGRQLFIDQESYGLHTEIPDIAPLFKKMPGAAKGKITADSARPDLISNLRKEGKLNVVAAKKGKDSIVEGVEFLRGYDIVCHPRCKHVVYELGAYSYKVDPLTDEVLPILVDKDNHFIDSLRYALEEVRRKKRFRFA